MDAELLSKLIIKEGPEPGTEFELGQPEITIGRSPAADFTIVFPAVSGKHLKVTEEKGQFFVEDLNSSNGTYLNGQRLTTRKALKGGDKIQLGQSIILLFEVPFIDQTMIQSAPFDATMLEVDISDFDLGETAVASTPPVIEKAPPPVQPIIQTPPPPPAPTPKPKPTPAPLAPEPGAGGETMMFEDFMASAPKMPPKIQVAVAGAATKTYTLTAQQLTIGRADSNSIVVPSKIVSRQHAVLEKVGDGYRIVPYPEAGNPVLLAGRQLTGPHHLKHNDKMRIGGLDPGSMVTLTYESPSEATASTGEATTISFDGDKTQITIGRDAGNDVVIDSPAISRYHAQLERVGQRYRVRDLRSSNGTFVNGQRIETETWLKPEDAVRIGSHRFVMGENELAQYDESRDLKVEAINLNKWVRKDLNILQNISLVFQPREFVVVVGQSGGGKSTLVDAIAGYRPATDGHVEVNDMNIYENFDVIRNDIGYVPQKDIIHMELTVFQALDYSAQLRMPPDTTEEERHKRVDEVLDDLDLAHRKDVQISGLSGGQQKRVSIGVELLTKPGLFYLDEPTSGLDPGTETSLMQLMRRLADQGRTIVLITHATKNVMLADKVVFLARGGYLSWFGPPDEALAYFNKYRSERDRRASDMEFDEIYGILDDQSKGTAEEWAQRFKENEAFNAYITEPLKDKVQTTTTTTTTMATAVAGPKRDSRVSGLRQFAILSSRNIKILTRDKFSLALMLAAPPLVSLLDVVLAFTLGRDPFDFNTGSIPNVMITLFLLSVYGVMVGGLSQMREIVKEGEVYKRERLVNLRLFPYIMSKIWVAALLALYASIVYTAVHYFAFDMPGGSTEFIQIYISMALATMAGMMLGLFSSALAPNANSAPLIVVLFMLPQIVLGGALVPLPDAVSAPTSTRWAFQAFMAITGSGSDVAKDACWTTLDTDQQKALTLDQKNDNCNCLGTNALHEDSCNYPGLGAFYNPAIDEPQPQSLSEPQPVEPTEPPEPFIPEQPVEPTDQSDLVAMGEFREELKDWQDEVQGIQDGYKAELDIYRGQVAVFRADLEAYQTRFAEREREKVTWQISQEGSVLPAEELIRQFYSGFGWTFVNKDNPELYTGTVIKTWMAQLAIILILFVGIMVLQKRKDAVN